MRRVLWGLMALATTIMVSCSKEKSFETETGGNNTTDGDLLAQIVIQYGADSSVTSFGYDGSKHLTSETNKGYLSIVSSDSLQQVTRDAEGIIRKVTIYPDALSSDAYDMTVRYDAQSKRYTSKLSYDSQGNVEDSIAYSYDASGRINKATAYVNYGSGFELLGRDTIIYDGNNNITRVVTSDYNDPDWEDVSELAITYDNKINPLKLSQEAVVLERYQYAGNNNPTKFSFINYDNPTANQEVTLTYTYNASDKPLTAALSLPGSGGATLPVVFKYQ